MVISKDEMEKIADLVVSKLQSDKNNFIHWFHEAQKAADDTFLMKRVEDIAFFEKVSLTGPPSQYQPNPTAQDAGNRLVFHAYTFLPKTVEKGKQYPLLVLPHGGVHDSFTSSWATIIRELIEQEYIVIAPDYRGSTGYGRAFYEKLDYGGLETEDTLASRNFMIETCDFVDPNRVGIIGWSHGGMHTLFNIFKYPEMYQAAYASVPVCDVIARMAYQDQDYRDLFEAENHIGKDVSSNVNEYRRRSPVWNVPKKLEVPLLIHTTKNDQEVNVLEVEHLIRALIAEGNVPDKDFWFKIFPPTPGAHGFNQLDTAFSKSCRGEVYDFLAARLNPPCENPLKKFKGTLNPLKVEKEVEEKTPGQ